MIDDIFQLYFELNFIYLSKLLNTSRIQSVPFEGTAKIMPSTYLKFGLKGKIELAVIEKILNPIGVQKVCL